MEIGALMTFLVPYLPFLTKLGEKFAETAGSELGKDVPDAIKNGWGKAKEIWAGLYSRVGENEKVRKAIEDFSNDPDDEEYKNTFQKKFNVFLNDFVKKYPDEAKAIAQILQEESSKSQPLETVGRDKTELSIENVTDSIVIGKAESQGGDFNINK